MYNMNVPSSLNSFLSHTILSTKYSPYLIIYCLLNVIKTMYKINYILYL